MNKLFAFAAALVVSAVTTSALAQGTKPAEPPVQPPATQPESKPETKPEAKPETKPGDIKPADAKKTEDRVYVQLSTSMGDLVIELDNAKAPISTENFLGYVEKGAYDGTIFHRVIKGFMIQTGDATNTGRGNPGYVIVDELPKGLRHDSAGVLSMANREHPNTGSTQFFVTVRDTKHLDGKHAVFGKCADAKVPIEISKVSVDHRAGDRPYEQVKINAVTIARKPKGKGKGK